METYCRVNLHLWRIFAVELRLVVNLRLIYRFQLNQDGNSVETEIGEPDTLLLTLLSQWRNCKHMRNLTLRIVAYDEVRYEGGF